VLTWAFSAGTSHARWRQPHHSPRRTSSSSARRGGPRRLDRLRGRDRPDAEAAALPDMGKARDHPGQRRLHRLRSPAPGIKAGLRKI